MHAFPPITSSIITNNTVMQAYINRHDTDSGSITTGYVEWREPITVMAAGKDNTYDEWDLSQYGSDDPLNYQRTFPFMSSLQGWSGYIAGYTTAIANDKHGYSQASIVNRNFCGNNNFILSGRETDRYMVNANIAAIGGDYDYVRTPQIPTE